MTRKFEEMAREYVGPNSVHVKSLAALLERVDRAATERAARVCDAEERKYLDMARETHDKADFVASARLDHFATGARYCGYAIRSTLDKKEGEDDAS